MPPILGVLGFILSVVSLGWQVHVYNEGFIEKALVRLAISVQLSDRDFPIGGKEFWFRGKKGDLTAEVVNIGQHPLYVKRVSLVVPCPEDVGVGAESRDFQPTQGTESGKPIQPGEAAVYRGGLWDFSDHPLDIGEPEEKYCVIVESNKGVVAQSSGLHSLTTSYSVPRKKESK
jgi:hypothetical protein